MIVKITERFSNEYGFAEVVGYSIETPKRSIHVYNMNDCPEDATLSRGLSFVYSIDYMIKEAYEAGKSGENLEFIAGVADE